VKRAVAILSGLLVFSLAGIAPSAEAAGGAVCAVSGTINFSPAANASREGTWRIDPAVINCQGIFRGYERITGPAAFTGSGTYNEVVDSDGTCLHHIGSGTVDYWVPTTEADVHIVEPHEFVLAGAGAFTTPSLNGNIALTPPFNGNCLTMSVTKATFVAAGVLVRSVGLVPKG
jgi:hypothetical protein